MFQLLMESCISNVVSEDYVSKRGAMTWGKNPWDFSVSFTGAHIVLPSGSIIPLKK